MRWVVHFTIKRYTIIRLSIKSFKALVNRINIRLFFADFLQNGWNFEMMISLWYEISLTSLNAEWMYKIKYIDSNSQIYSFGLFDFIVCHKKCYSWGRKFPYMQYSWYNIWLILADFCMKLFEFLAKSNKWNKIRLYVWLIKQKCKNNQFN